MNTLISFTPAQLIAGIAAICGTITALAAVVALIAKLINKAKAPERAQDDRIRALEIDVEQLKKWAANDKAAIKDIEEGNRVTQTALLALLSHAIDGNNTDELRKAKNSLNEYLIRK